MHFIEFIILYNFLTTHFTDFFQNLLKNYNIFPNQTGLNVNIWGFFIFKDQSDIYNWLNKIC